MSHPWCLPCSLLELKYLNIFTSAQNFFSSALPSVWAPRSGGCDAGERVVVVPPPERSVCGLTAGGEKKEKKKKRWKLDRSSYMLKDCTLEKSGSPEPVSMRVLLSVLYPVLSLTIFGLYPSMVSFISHISFFFYTLSFSCFVLGVSCCCDYSSLLNETRGSGDIRQEPSPRYVPLYFMEAVLQNIQKSHNWMLPYMQQQM